MRDENEGKTGTEPAKSELGLGRCLVDGDAETSWRGRLSRRKTFGVSLGVEVLLLGLLVAAPLLTSVAQPTISRPAFVPFLFGAPHPKRIVSRPTNPIHHAPNYRGDPIIYAMGPLHERPLRRTDGTEDSPAQIPDVFPVDPGPYATPLVGLRPTAPVAPSEENKRNADKRPLKLSEGVVQAQLVTRIEPRYPPLALQMRQAGIVVLHAIISRDGRISALEVVSGSPFFVQAALDAVRQWRYRPTLLNGEPVEVETTITVEFRLQH
jgi:protein TonB